MWADKVLQGHGTTNTGNIARTCFKDPEKFARSLEIDSEIVQNIATIIALFRVKEDVYLDRLKTLCRETYNLHYRMYP